MMKQKVTSAKKVSIMNNQFFHARQPPAEFFLFLCTVGLYFNTLMGGPLFMHHPVEANHS